MTPTINNNTDLINLDSLDDWLESDLRQSGILLPSAVDNKPFDMVSPAQILMASPPISECTPRMDPLLDLTTPLMKYEPLSPMETPKMEPQDISKSAIDLQPFIKALTLLGSIQYNQQDSNINRHSNSNNNSNNNNNNNNNNSNTNYNKRERSESIDDNQDLVVLKRQRNTDAARRSRQRKAQKMDTLEKRVLDLESDNERLRLRAAVAESERANIEAKEKRSRVRVLELERQLADTHKALLRYNQSTTPTKSTISV
ncbi:hypothetical protein INT47_010160 [Mucor saturninus]|uniref:BZIP domain-containing protein n=1 Tax=Mucor saturninus TaxID=64648 RepID=A0A8H7VBM0_9FUNG|nr:hypothetical protein INT47_010160 [Mucor saturninus]